MGTFHKERTLWVPADRFVAAFAGRQPLPDTPAARRLSDLRSGRQQFVRLETADAMFVGAGIEYLWHVSRADGGFADIYEDGAQYGCPSNQPRIYETEAERAAADLRNWNRSRRRALRMEHRERAA